MRVSLRGQYSTFLYDLQETQSRLMDLNMQASSQKRILKPSDDPIGTARVMNYRDSISAITQYQSNIDTAKGWLGLADESMLQTSTILTKLAGLAEQGATGTMTESDREATSYEVRQLFSQLISLSNTQYEGNSIFAGHKVAENAYEEGLMVYDQDGNSLGLATGASDRSIVVQFVGTGGTTAEVGTDAISYRYSADGGVTWTDKTLDTVEPHVLELDGVSVALAEGYQVELTPASETKTSNGSWLSVAPTAIYQGDHEAQSAVTYADANPTFSALPLGGFEQDTQVGIDTGVTFGTVPPATFDVTISTTVNGVAQTTVLTMDNLAGATTPVLQTPYGGIQLSGTAAAGDSFTVKAGMTGVRNFGSDVNAMGKGAFSDDIMVRIDNAGGVVIGDGTDINYSYSTNGGVNWSGGHKASNAAGATSVDLLVPGGALELSQRGVNGDLAENAQFVIHPHTAGQDLEISAGQYVQINNVGSEIFGGFHDSGTEAIFADSDPGRNIFVTVGKLVAALENNDQQGCAEALDNLQTSQEFFSTQLASVGGRENRLEVAGTVLSGLKLNQESRMSTIEDVDLATLLTDLANQQTSYEAVLKSSSMIMKMGLINYL